MAPRSWEEDLGVSEAELERPQSIASEGRQSSPKPASNKRKASVRTRHTGSYTERQGITCKQDGSAAGVKIVKRALVVCGGAPACKKCV